jgi:hypothetical protein
MNTARGSKTISFEIRIFIARSKTDNSHAYSTAYSIVITHYLCGLLISFHRKVIHHLMQKTQITRCLDKVANTNRCIQAYDSVLQTQYTALYSYKRM